MPEPNGQVLTVVCLAFRSSEPWQSTLLPLTLFMPQPGKYLRALTVAMSGQSWALNGHRKVLSRSPRSGHWTLIP